MGALACSHAAAEQKQRQHAACKTDVAAVVVQRQTSLSSSWGDTPGLLAVVLATRSAARCKIHFYYDVVFQVHVRAMGAPPAQLALLREAVSQSLMD